MTCITAIIDKNGRGHIASDSIGSNGHTKSLYKNKKVFKKDNMLIGYTSSFRMGQLLEHSLSLPQRKVDQSLEEYMYKEFVNSVRDLFIANGFVCNSEGRESFGTFLIVVEGRIFKLCDDLSLLESQDRFNACGSGEDYALAAMDIMTRIGTVTKPERILKESLDTVSKYVVSVGGGMVYLHE